MPLLESVNEQYIQILREELIPALGCTEPIAIAYASARATKLLGKTPEHIVAKCSGNIIKNVKGVVVPNAGGMKGIETAAIIGAIGGNSDRKLETLAEVTEADIQKTKELLQQKDYCDVKLLQSGINLHIIMEVSAGEDTVTVEIADEHTNIIREQKNDTILYQSEAKTSDKPQSTDRSCLNVQDIIEFANTIDVEKVKDILDRQISYNTKISEEGLTHDYGARVGKTLLSVYGDEDVKIRAKARAAAGSDARMSGCVLPVVINSGSGNQGMTVSLPVIEYARDLKVSQEKLYRALLVSNLIAIHQKTLIGRLSAYCGAVSAACGSGAAITYLKDGTYQNICDTITNTLANVSGIVCDGAKSSCAAKIASSVDAALLGHYMAMEHDSFQAGDGLVKTEVEGTIQSIGRLGKEGMKETDVEILNIMIEK